MGSRRDDSSSADESSIEFEAAGLGFVRLEDIAVEVGEVADMIRFLVIRLAAVRT